MSKNIPIFKEVFIEKISNDLSSLDLNSSSLRNLKNFENLIKKHKEVIIELMFIYLYDATNRPFSVGYSGGKDSTVTLDMVLNSLVLIKEIYGSKALSKKTYVLFSDTLMELDPVIQGIYDSLAKVQSFCDELKLNVHVEKVSPVLKNTFWSLIIGKGYILPNSNNRFCSERFKIMPQQAKIDEILKENNQGFIAITGQRQDESLDRKKRLEIQTIDGSFKTHEYKNCSSYTPIEHWNSNQVWDYIYSSTFSWVDKNYLGKIYAEASGDGDECKSLLMGFEATAPGCGKSGRFGCWICPLHFNKDKTLINLGKKHTYLQKMEIFRNWLVDDATGQWNWKRDVYIHGKHKMKKYDRDNHRKNMMLPGGYTLLYRKEILIRLAALELDVLEERNGKYLITDEELAYIQEIWIEDGDMDMSVQKICKHRSVQISSKYKEIVEAASVMQNKTYYGEHLDETIYGESWEIIKGLNRNVCARYYTQMALQIQKQGYDAKLVLEGLRYGNRATKKALVLFIKTLPVETRMDFVENSKENYIRHEWKKDEIGFLTFLEMYEKKEIEKPQRTLFGFEGEYGKHFEALEELNKVEDITQVNNDLISLEDKMRYFDNY